LILALLHDRIACSTGVGGDGLDWGDCAILVDTWWLVRVTHDDDVVTPTERVLVDGTWDQVDLGIFTWSLASRRTIIVPRRKVRWGFGDLVKDSGFGSEILASSANPDILGSNLAELREVVETLPDLGIEQGTFFGCCAVANWESVCIRVIGSCWLVMREERERNC